MGLLEDRSATVAGIEFRCTDFDHNWGACGCCDSCRARASITDLTRKLEIAKEALEFYATQWEQDVDAEQTVHGWHGSIGDVEPSGELQEDEGSLARQALAAMNGEQDASDN